MARRDRSLKLLRLARDKKSLIWQKRYLMKILEQQYYRQTSELPTKCIISPNSLKQDTDLKVSWEIRENIINRNNIIGLWLRT